MENQNPFVLQQAQNKETAVSVSVTEQPWGKISIIVLIILFFTGCFWIMLSKALAMLITPGTSIINMTFSFVLISLWLTFFLASFSLLILGIEEKWIIVTTSLLLALTTLTAPSTNLIITSITTILFFFACVAFAGRLRSITNNYIRFAPSHVLPSALAPFFIVLSVIVGILSFQITKETNIQEAILKPIIHQTSATVASVMFGKTMTINEQTTVLQIAESVSSGADGNFSFISDIPGIQDTQKQTKELIIEQTEKSILQSFSQPNADPKTSTIVGLIENSLMEKVSGFIQPWVPYLPYLYAFSAFLTLRFFASFWIWAVVLFTPLFIKMFEGVGFITRLQEQKTVERIHII
ncbi:MAG: hypothetical protein WCP97_01980 [bacterium]